MFAAFQALLYKKMLCEARASQIKKKIATS